MTEVLLVDDDIQLVKSLAMALNAEGFDVAAFSTADEALKGLENKNPSIAVLDITMPDMNGIDLMERIRENMQIPVIFLTGRDDEVDQVLALRLGADDYVTKPCSARLVSERIRAILRRGAKPAVTAPVPGPKPAETGDLHLDDRRHSVTWKGMPVALTSSEYLLVKALTEEPGFVKSREELIGIVYDEHTQADDRTIDTHVKRLRKKFRDCDPHFSSIKTIYGIGYKFVSP